ncbi:DUF3846 domain-containing protein [Leifsonia sp. NPDC102414]|uniref:DUF3846 domain-containing protein n=1 Tax=Leifsonia sp. NPDC102414 TaxID=3364124 RepID=UPI0037F966D3
MLSGIVIDPHGGIANVWCSFRSEGQRQEWMRGHIDCERFECVSLPESIDVWVDEEFLYNGAPVNDELTRIVGRHQPSTPIRGNGLILGVDPATGNTVSLTLDQQASVIAWWRTFTTGGNNPEALRPRMALV